VTTCRAGIGGGHVTVWSVGIGGAGTTWRSVIGGHVTAGSVGIGGARCRSASECEGGRWEGKRRRYCFLFENDREHSRRMIRRK
jgi:hypothetical protein